MLIKEDLLRKLIALKLNEKRINENIAAKRQARKERRAERQADRDADRFEKSDPGPKLKDIIKSDIAQTTDATYEYVLSEVDRIMPLIEDIEQRYRGIKLVKTLKNRREKRFTIGQVKRFIKTGLAYTKAKDYSEAADEFCAAGAFLESPKTPENRVINVDREIIDTLYDLCEGLGKGGKFPGVKSKGGTPRSGGGSKQPPRGTNKKEIVKEIQKILKTCSGVTDYPLTIDGIWGDETQRFWEVVVADNLLPGSRINGVDVTDEIVDTVYDSWPDGGPLLNYAGKVEDCLEFLRKICDQSASPGGTRDGGGSSVPIGEVDCGWAARRTAFRKAEIQVGKDLDKASGGSGLDINLVYDMEEFEKYNPGKVFTDFTQTSDYYSIEEVTDFGMQAVERHQDGPSLTRVSSFHLGFPVDDYYYNCETQEMLISTATGDGILQNVIVVGDKLFYSRNPDKDFAVSEVKKKILNEEVLRSFLRLQLLKEQTVDFAALEKGLDAGLDLATKSLDLAQAGMSNEQLKDVIRQTGQYLDNFQAGGETASGMISGAELNKRLELATKMMTAGKNQEAAQNFKAILGMVETAPSFDGKGTTVEIFRSLVKVLDDKTKTTPEDVKKLAQAVEKAPDKRAGSSGEAKKSKKKKANDKVKTIQELLNKINKDDPKIATDGIWGDKTQKAYVKAVKISGKKWVGLLANKTEFTKVSRSKWEDAVKILNSGKKKEFKPNIDGMISFLQYVVAKTLEKESDVPEVDAETKA